MAITLLILVKITFGVVVARELSSTCSLSASHCTIKLELTVKVSHFLS